MHLRERVVAAVDAGMTQPQAAARFGVSLASMSRAIAGLALEPWAELTPGGHRRRAGRPVKQKA